MTDTADTPEAVRPPRMIVFAFAATIAHVVLSVANSAMLWGFQDYLRGQLIKSNNKAKAKDKKDYTSIPDGVHRLNHDLHNGLNVGLIQIAIFGLLVLLLAVNFRKGRGWARWAEILVLVIVVQAPFRLLNLGGDAPTLMRLVSGLVGLTGIAVIVLLVLPESSRYFAAVRGVTAGGRAGAPGGLRSLFGPRPRPDDEPALRPARSGSRTPPSTKPAKTPAKPAAKAPADVNAGPNAKVPVKPDVTDKRPKAKVRAGVDAGADTSPAPKPPSAKSRGKSRRSS